MNERRPVGVFFFFFFFFLFFFPPPPPDYLAPAWFPVVGAFTPSVRHFFREARTVYRNADWRAKMNRLLMTASAIATLAIPRFPSPTPIRTRTTIGPLARSLPRPAAGQTVAPPARPGNGPTSDQKSSGQPGRSTKIAPALREDRPDRRATTVDRTSRLPAAGDQKPLRLPTR